MTIRFGRLADPYGWMSNFAPHAIVVDGKRWPTSEHYFQAQKFAGTAHEDAIRLAASPMIAAHMGRSRKRPLRSDWETVKDDVMRRAVSEKFRQHASLRAALLATGDAEIVEQSKRDAYWGDGGDGKGRNMLGRILMEVRAALASTLDPRVDVLRRVVRGEGKRWVLFAHGSVVFMTKDATDLGESAREILRVAGPVHVGSPSADFSVVTLPEDLGWAVTGHHPDILTLVRPDEVDDANHELAIGLLGRSKRASDAESLEIVHVEG